MLNFKILLFLYVHTTTTRCNEDGGFISQNQYMNCARYPLVWTLSRTDTCLHLITPTECYARFWGFYFSLKRYHHEFFLDAIPPIPQICKESSSSYDRHVLEEVI